MNDQPKEPRQGAGHAVSRRKFLKNSAAAGAAAGIAMPYFVPSHVLAAPGRPGANDRIGVGHIGVGGQGMSHVREGAVAICDVDSGHIGPALHKAGGTPFTCKDFRQLLERKDVDAVYIATPDHWHAIMAVMAMQAGKDVYSEKPVCKTIQEADAMLNAVERYQRVLQIGAQGRSHPLTRKAVEYMRNGQIGKKISYVDVWHPTNWVGGKSQDSDPPADLDWDMWLGPAQWRPYNKDSTHFNFRWLMDIGAGFIRDRGNHVLSCMMWCLGADEQQPVSVEASGLQDKVGAWDTPVTMNAKWEFKNPDWTCTWAQPGRERPFPGQSKNHLIDWGFEAYGELGSMVFRNGDGGVDVEDKAKQYQAPADGFNLPEPGGADGTQNHRDNWFDCIRRRDLKPRMNIWVGRNVITLPIIANISYILGRKLQWDGASRRFVGDEEANRLLAQPYRAPWHL